MAEKILIVDDDLETLRLIGIMLQRQGYEITAASNGAQALTMARNELPDIIILDVMMPNMDGYEVTREIRQDPILGDIPILMFTAQSKVDDKIIGYDAGADDYLTKPVHPAELVAHVKALLSRTRVPQPTIQVEPEAFIIGIIGSKGGLGVSTLALNLASVLAETHKLAVIAAELRPGQGTWRDELAIPVSPGLEELLAHTQEGVTSKEPKKFLSETSFGVRLLLASNQSTGIDFAHLPDQLQTIITELATLTKVLILDLGTPFCPGYEKLCDLCDSLLVVTDAAPITVRKAKHLINEIKAASNESSSFIELILLNRARSECQLTAPQITEKIPGVELKILVPPAPELAFKAYEQRIPMVKVNPNDLAVQQITELARLMVTLVNK